MRRLSWALGALACTAMLAGCMENDTKLGGGSSEVTGSGGAAGSQGQSNQLTKCARPIGTAALVEPDNTYYTNYGLTSPVPLVRLMMAQSGCFRVVDRGRASAAMRRERQLASGGELQKGSSMGRGQMVAADYLITPNIIFQDQDSGGGGGGLGAFLPGLAGAVAGGMRTKNQEAQVTLFVTNVRSGVQEAVAEGSAKKRDISFGGLGWVGGVAGVGGAYESTDIGKIVSAAFMDAHNKLVNQLDAATPAASQPDAAGYMTSGAVNFRSGPTTKAPIIKTLKKGTPVRPTGEKQGNWWAVEAEGRSGWLHSNYITR